jgi:glycosyltransferase involved in cell wall biosynthesis
VGRLTDSPLRLLHVFAGPFPTVQGTQALVATTCRLLAGLGHDVHLLCYAHAAFEREEPFTVHRIPDQPAFHGERSGPHPRKLALDLSLAARCRRLVSRLRPDIVHAHHYEALVAAALADPFRSAPRVLHLHALMAPELHTYFRPALARSMRAVGERIDSIVPFLADRVIALDDDGRAALIRRGFPAERVIVGRVPAAAPPGFAPPPVERGRGEGPLRAVYAGNLDGYQGLDVLLSAFGSLAASRGDGVRLEVVTASRADDFEARVRRLGLERLVRVSRHGAPEAVFRAVASADMAVVPRCARGGVPVKLVNALAAGVPVIADRALAEHVAHGDEAWLVDMRSPDALAAGIGALADSKELRAALARGALRAAGRVHDPGRCARALEDLYRDLLSK